MNEVLYKVKSLDKDSVSAVVLCFNEAQNLARCLGSLSWCCEIVVVDSGSTDGSQSIAVQLGARVLERRQEGAFIITDQRNWVLDHGDLKGSWVLFLDADEEIGTKCRDQIQSSLNVSACIDGFELAPRYWFLGKWLKHTQGYPNWHPRLVRRGHIRLEGTVWESFPKDANVSRIPQPYEHFANSKGINDWTERHCRYSDWEATYIHAFLSSRDTSKLGTRRALNMRRLAASLWPTRPALRFIQKYILQLGLLDGWQGLLFSLLMAYYELITVVKIIELKRKERGLMP